ncbi:MAG TPA: hypothetical protein VFA02_05245 [Pseudacidobacterium sp.]|nr:hypothetical protein [Pseudacidobacterium sp.]
MRTTVNIDADAYDYAYCYAYGKGISLGKAISELIRKAEKAPQPEMSSRLKLNEHGYYEIVGPGDPITIEDVKKYSEDPIE